MNPNIAPTLTSRLAALPAVLWIIGGIGWLTGEAITASAYPAYSYATNYISDLGVPEVGSFQGRAIDSPLSAVMNTTFLGHGLLFALAGIIAAILFTAASRRARVSIGVLAGLHWAGITLVGLFHGSEASVESGVIVLHIFGAAVAIIAGNLVAIIAGVASRRLGAPKAYRIASIVLGILGIVSLIMLMVDSTSTTVNLLPDGVWERGAVYTIVGWELLTGVLLLVARARRRNATVTA